MFPVSSFAEVCKLLSLSVSRVDIRMVFGVPTCVLISPPFLSSELTRAPIESIMVGKRCS